MDQFMQWLNSHRDDDVIGYSSNSYVCPIANYYRALGHSCEVGEQIFIDGKEREMEEWEKLFVDAIDDLGCCMGIGPRYAEQVLQQIASS